MLDTLPGYYQPPLYLTPNIYETPLDIIYSGKLPNSSHPNSMSDILNKFDPNFYRFEFYNTSDIYEWDDYNFQKRSPERKGTYFFKNYNYLNQNYSYIALANSISFDSGAVLMNQMNKAIIRNATKDPLLNVTAINHPLPYTNKIKELIKIGNGLGAAFTFGMGMV